jgi:hypothetical protein
MDKKFTHTTTKILTKNGKNIINYKKMYFITFIFFLKKKRIIYLYIW